MSKLEGWQNTIRGGEISMLPDAKAPQVGCAVSGVLVNPSRRSMGAVCGSSIGSDFCALPFGKCEHQHRQ